MEEYKINLRNLFTKNRSDLPDWVDKCNCIYCIRNILNGDRYIGQAKWLYNRFVTNTEWSHLINYKYVCMTGYNYSHLYNAIRKYRCRNFEVSILEYNLETELLNEREVYWISYYHTYFRDPEYNGGYNMTSGGDDTSHMHTFEANLKRVETDKANHGGVMGWNLKESLERSIETRKSNGDGDCMYGCHRSEVVRYLIENTDIVERRVATNIANHGGVLAFNTESAITKSHEVLEEYYGSKAGRLLDPEVRKLALDIQRSNNNGKLKIELPDVRKVAISNSHTKEAEERRAKTDMDNHGGVRGFHTHESEMKSQATHIKRYGKLMAGVHTEEGILNQRLSCWFRFSDRYRSECDGSVESYWNRCTWSHIYFLRDNYDILRSWDKWTAFHEEFYKYILTRI